MFALIVRLANTFEKFKPELALLICFSRAPSKFHDALIAHFNDQIEKCFIISQNENAST